MYVIFRPLNVQFSLTEKRLVLLGAFAKLRKATISFVMSVCPSVRFSVFLSTWNNSAASGWILYFYTICREAVSLFSGTRVCAFKPGRRAKKILSTPSFGGKVKPSVPCRTLRHVKDPKTAWKSSCRLNLPGNILAHSSTLRC